MGEGWQEKNGLLTCHYWVLGTTAKVERYLEN